MGLQANDPGDKPGFVRFQGMAMRDLFKSWRRKAGCGLLIAAILQTTLWMRSYAFNDSVWITTVGEIGSARGGVYWSRALASEPCGWGTQGDSMLQRDFGNASLAECLKSEGNEDSGYLMYWQTVLPLTVASADLILWKPRKKLST